MILLVLVAWYMCLLLLLLLLPLFYISLGIIPAVYCFLVNCILWVDLPYSLTMPVPQQGNTRGGIFACHFTPA